MITIAVTPKTLQVALTKYVLEILRSSTSMDIIYFAFRTSVLIVLGNVCPPPPPFFFFFFFLSPNKMIISAHTFLLILLIEVYCLIQKGIEKTMKFCK